jgi:molybdate transport system substrate-binding protein
VIVAIASALAIRQTEALASTGQIVVLSANVFTGTLDELAGEFERATGHSVNILYGTAGEIRQRVEAGEFCDVTILPRPLMNDLSRQGRVAQNTIVDFARSSVGLAVRAGAPKPDISTVETFKRSLAAAESISYPNPSRGGATGALFTRVLQQLGMADEIRLKTKFPPSGQFAVDLVARGEAQIAISQPMEVLGKAGVELVGLLPTELQDPPNFVFSAGVPLGAKEPEAAQALISFLLGRTAAFASRARGMNPN